MSARWYAVPLLLALTCFGTALAAIWVNGTLADRLGGTAFVLFWAALIAAFVVIWARDDG